jgi:hypothetical protein
MMWWFVWGARKGAVRNFPDLPCGEIFRIRFFTSLPRIYFRQMSGRILKS